MVLEATADMGEWSVEVRSGSALLCGTGYDQYLDQGGAEPRHTPRACLRPTNQSADTDDLPAERGLGFAVPVEDIGKVMAALEQVMAHGVYRYFQHSHQEVSGVWATPEVRSGLVYLHGPVLGYGSCEPWSLVGMVELDYRSLADVHARLATLA